MAKTTQRSIFVAAAFLLVACGDDASPEREEQTSGAGGSSGSMTAGKDGSSGSDAQSSGQGGASGSGMPARNPLEEAECGAELAEQQLLFDKKLTSHEQCVECLSDVCCEETRLLFVPTVDIDDAGVGDADASAWSREDGGYHVPWDWDGVADSSYYLRGALDAIVECFERNAVAHEELSSQTIARACSEELGFNFMGRRMVACATGAPAPTLLPGGTEQGYREGDWSSEDDAGADEDNCARECFPSWR